MKSWKFGALVVFALGLGTGLVLPQLGSPAGAEEPPKRSPVEPVPDRDVYYPGTEPIAPDEMRIVACGKGMPSVRPKQAAASTTATSKPTPTTLMKWRTRSLSEVRFASSAGREGVFTRPTSTETGTPRARRATASAGFP